MVSDRKMRMTMPGNGTGSSYLIVLAVSPDKTIWWCDYRLFIVSISQCCMSFLRTKCSRATTSGNINSCAVLVLVAIWKKWFLEIMMRAYSILIWCYVWLNLRKDRWLVFVQFRIVSIIVDPNIQDRIRA